MNQHTMELRLKPVGYLVLSAAALVGLWGVVVTLTRGHIEANTTQHVAWGLWVALYIYFLGLSAGSFLLSTLIYAFDVKRLEQAGPLALLQALGCLILGGVLIVLDLGHPLRVYHVLFSFNSASVMSWMGLFYNVYILIILAELYLVLRPQLVRLAQTGKSWYRWLSLGSIDISATSLARDARWLKTLAIVGIPVAMTVHGGVGAIFAVAKARPNWFSGLFPIIFIVSALVSGGALLTLLVAVCSRQPAEEKLTLVRDLAKMTIGILCFDLVLLLSEILVTLYGNVPAEVAGWAVTLFGSYWWAFWIIQIGVGAVIPIAIVSNSRLNQSIRWLGWAGCLVTLGILGARLILVIPPQMIPVFESLPEVHRQARFSLGYFPSAVEWSVAIGSFALGAWLFLAALKVLPLRTEEREGI